MSRDCMRKRRRADLACRPGPGDPSSWTHDRQRSCPFTKTRKWLARDRPFPESRDARPNGAGQPRFERGFEAGRPAQPVECAPLHRSARQPMRIASVGGGPAGLYFSLLFKKSFPDADITVYERNRADDTFGWGVVFSDETLSHFEAADPESFARIKAQFAYWTDIETHVGGQVVTSTGHGFCGLSRRRLLNIFHERCRQLGVRLVFGREVKTLADVPGNDLVLAADGLNSVLRKQF